MSETIESSKIIEDLLFDIEEEKCVLLIGPEISGRGGKSQTRIIHEQLLEQEAKHIAYYYPKDSLFLFKEDTDKNRAIRGLKRLYRDLAVPKALYKKILELPIPMIISLNPDIYLSQVAEELGLQHDFKHFRYSGEAAEEVAAPSKERPLLYNLSGCLEEDESLVLDYEDLFKLLKAVLPDGLPQKIRIHLRRSSSFLFLGFDFEKWYSQLLLQLLTYERKGRPKFAVKAQLQDNDAKDFLIHQFQVKFLAHDEHFFDTLYEALGKANLLRPLRFPAEFGTIPVKDLQTRISNGQLAEALEELARFAMPLDQQQQLTALQAQYNQWQSKEDTGRFHVGESDVVRNRITADFLQLLNHFA